MSWIITSLVHFHMSDHMHNDILLWDTIYLTYFFTSNILCNTLFLQLYLYMGFNCHDLTIHVLGITNMVTFKYKL